ncbi:alpha/beta fold hydrolase [Agrobacterium vitis]|uniref:Alpha/beta fold hydrolase n=1 Tax=Agrobacterium vitis TaxID=373 RepID=A0ABD6GDP9_AGRVI|nr:alpha/beta fold hydrolase [Agrobacterium vitis]MUO81103.1 alpha/beta fold hydrolase [Agrobacterium vitis]MUO95739.1 alpha/beta fold hydrolase [Agrobacterium vitis]MUP06784.1 alpha/beta fold hydrolase [Agrobacterium vitis]MUZ84564.1 alpha/beta fold hydrolase [Agrobacterium vitis]MVA10473.1 alpha/beta fold hydrolase [Agrobacterium vitis]
MQHLESGTFQDRTVIAADGMQLFARDYQASDDTQLAAQPPVVCLPGLTRNHRDFTQLARRLSAGGRRVICIDSRGRGGSGRDPDPKNYNLLTEMADVVAVLDELAVAQADFIGTSRGGLLLHFLAVMHSSRIRRVILNDVGPVLEKEGLIAIRDYLSGSGGPKTWADCPDYLKSVHGATFPVLEQQDWEDMAQALYRDENSIPVADYDPAIAAQISSIDFSKPIPDLWAQYEALAPFPLLIIRGEHSQLLSKQASESMIARHPSASLVIADGQGHAPLLHLMPLADDIERFLSRR